MHPPATRQCTTAVQKTAFESSSRKVHTVSKGYYEDPFVHYFASDRTINNSPLMNRGYWLRTKVFENSLVHFSDSVQPTVPFCDTSSCTENKTEGESAAPRYHSTRPIQVINAGAGFDTLYFRWANNTTLAPTTDMKDRKEWWGKNSGIDCTLDTGGSLSSYFESSSPAPSINIVKFLELDVEEMVAVKRQIINRNPELRKLASKKVSDSLQKDVQGSTKDETKGDNIYHLISCDLGSSVQVDQALKVNGLQPDIPTFVLAECVLVYIPSESSSSFLSQLVQFFSQKRMQQSNVTPEAPLSTLNHLQIATYDMIHPTDRFGDMMIQNLGRMHLSIESIHDFPTVQDHEKRCKNVGFTVVKGMTMKALYTSVSKSQQTALNKIEMIDDWDEWNLVHDHYCWIQAAFSTKAQEGGDGPQPVLATPFAKVKI